MNRKMGKMMVKALSEEMVRPGIQGRGEAKEGQGGHSGSEASMNTWIITT